MTTSKLPEAFSYAAPAAVDLSAKLNYFAVINSSGKIAVAGDGAAVAGTIIEVAVADKGASIQFGGIGKVVCAEAVTPGNRIASDADGKAVVAAVGDFEVGTALGEAVSAAGDVISFIFASGRRSA